MLLIFDGNPDKGAYLRSGFFFLLLARERERERVSFFFLQLCWEKKIYKFLARDTLNFDEVGEA